MTGETKEADPSPTTLEQLRKDYLFISRITAEQTEKTYEEARQNLKILIKIHFDDGSEAKVDLSANNGKSLSLFFDGLAQVLVMSVNLLDFEVMHNEWLPQYLRVVEAHTTDELDFLLLGRIF